MDADYFRDLTAFVKTHDPEIAAHYVGISKAVKRHLMYDFDTGGLVTHDTFGEMVANGEVDKYSETEEHPVFWEGNSYTDHLDTLISFRDDIDILASGLSKTLETDPSLFQTFAQQLYYVEPSILMALRIHPGLQHVMTKRQLWEELFRFDAKVSSSSNGGRDGGASKTSNGQENGRVTKTSNTSEVKIPIAFHIDRLYLSQCGALWTSDVVENVDETVTDDLMIARAIEICERDELLPKDRITLIRDGKLFRFSIVFTQDGVDILPD